MSAYAHLVLRLGISASDLRHPENLDAMRRDARAGNLDVEDLRSLRNSLESVLDAWDSTDRGEDLQENRRCLALAALTLAECADAD